MPSASTKPGGIEGDGRGSVGGGRTHGHRERVFVERHCADRRPKVGPFVGLLLERGRDERLVEKMLVDQNVAVDAANSLVAQILNHVPEVAGDQRGVALTAQHQPGDACPFLLAVEPRLEAIVPRAVSRAPWPR